jgi:hypothetical protein
MERYVGLFLLLFTVLCPSSTSAQQDNAENAPTEERLGANESVAPTPRVISRHPIDASAESLPANVLMSYTIDQLQEMAALYVRAGGSGLSDPAEAAKAGEFLGYVSALLDEESVANATVRECVRHQRPATTARKVAELLVSTPIPRDHVFYGVTLRLAINAVCQR